MFCLSLGALKTARRIAGSSTSIVIRQRFLSNDSDVVVEGTATVIPCDDIEADGTDTGGSVCYNLQCTITASASSNFDTAAAGGKIEAAVGTGDYAAKLYEESGIEATVILPPSTVPSSLPSSIPSVDPSSKPIAVSSLKPSFVPSGIPSASPSSGPSLKPSQSPSDVPSSALNLDPSSKPSAVPSLVPSSAPSFDPSVGPSAITSEVPSAALSFIPSISPSFHQVPLQVLTQVRCPQVCQL